jgi:hypothetical protein
LRFIDVIIFYRFRFVYDVGVAVNLSFFSMKNTPLISVIEDFNLYVVSEMPGSDVYRQSDIQPKPQLMPCFQKEVQSYSSSGCIDEHLADPFKEDNIMNSSMSSLTSHKETTTKADDTNAGNGKATVLMSDQTGEELRSVSMNFFDATAREKETERFGEFLQCLSGNVDDHVESDIFGGTFFGEQHHELFSPQVNKLIWVHYVHIN